MTAPCHSAPDARSTSAARLHLCPNGHVQRLTPQARQLLQTNPQQLRIRDGRLASADASGLQRCLQQAHGGQRAALSLRRPNQTPLTLLAAPSPDGPRGCVHITLRDPQAEAPEPALLRELFGLTPVEAQVTRLLSEGRRTTDIAAMLGIQPNTVQAHLKSVYGKTGCRHQAALLALVLRSVAMAPVTDVFESPAGACNGPDSTPPAVTGDHCVDCPFGQ